MLISGTETYKKMPPAARGSFEKPPLDPAKRLTCRRNIHGKWLVQLRKGIPSTIPVNNTYLLEAVELRKLLFTLPELHEGLSTIFDDNKKPLLLDVGCYFGDTVVELAAANSHLNVLGLDVKYKRVVKSCRKIKRAKVDNARIAISDVQDFLPLLAPDSLQGVCVFYPDPWRKTKHEKYRFLNPSFFETLYPLLHEDGFIWFKTDHNDYFDEVSEAVKSSGFQMKKHLPEEIIKDRQYKTLFEEMFIKQNKSLYQMVLVKRSA